MLHAAPYGWSLPPADAVGFGAPCAWPALACGAPPPPTAWAVCGCGRPGCPGCPIGYAAAAASHDCLRVEVAALAAAAAAVGLPVPAPPPPLVPPLHMAFMPVAEAGGRGSKEGDADVARMEGGGSDCEGSTGVSEEGLAAGAARRPLSPSAAAAAATAAVEEAAAAAAVAVRSLAASGSQGMRGQGGGARSLPRTLQAADQLTGELLHTKLVTMLMLVVAGAVSCS